MRQSKFKKLKKLKKFQLRRSFRFHMKLKKLWIDQLKRSFTRRSLKK